MKINKNATLIPNIFQKGSRNVRMVSDYLYQGQIDIGRGTRSALQSYKWQNCHCLTSNDMGNLSKSYCPRTENSVWFTQVQITFI